jgi:hypothetical protein
MRDGLNNGDYSAQRKVRHTILNVKTPDIPQTFYLSDQSKAM